jgi:RNA polymerase sigma-70 factor (ECF subfamily)
MSEGDRDTQELVRLGKEADPSAIQDLFSRHRERLKRMAQLRLHPRLQGRLDASDVVQDVYLEAYRRLQEYLADPKVPFFLWLRSIAGQKLVDLHRRHLGAKARDPRREVYMNRAPMPEATTAVIAAQLVGSMATPSQEFVQAEKRQRVQEALEAMDPKDREVLILRHFEHLTNTETAQELDIKESTASQRYVRALVRLKGILTAMAGGSADTWL